MIKKRYTHVMRAPAPTVVRALEVGRIPDVAAETPDAMAHVIVLGCIDKKLYIMDEAGAIQQTIPFNGWVRSCRVFDVDNDGGASEIITGAGDNSLVVFEYDADKQEFCERFKHEFENNVSGVDAGDIDGDGVVEIVAGSWDQTLRAFSGASGEEKWRVDVPDQVSTVRVGDISWDGRAEIVVGLKNGTVLALAGESGEVLWQYEMDKTIIAIEIGDADNRGKNEVLVGGSNGVILILDADGKAVHEIDVGERILAIKIGDTDGDNAADIIVGCGDNRVRVYENTTRTYEGIKLRWRANFPGTVRGIWIGDFNNDGIPNIVTGGYDKEIRVLRDYQYGEKDPMEIFAQPLEGSIPEGNAGEGAIFPYRDNINCLEDLLLVNALASRVPAPLEAHGGRVITDARFRETYFPIADLEDALSLPDPSEFEP